MRTGALIASFALAAGILYLAIGSRHSLERPGPGIRGAASVGGAANSGKGAATAKSMDLRATVGTWPVSFRLDDSMAMVPSRRLSQFDRVVIEARISRSGQATPAAGDLYVTSQVQRPAAGTRLALVINREIG